MTATADDIQARIDALQKARDAGVLEIRHGMDITTFRSHQEMNAVLQSLKAQLAAIQGVTPRSRVNYIEQRSAGFGHRDDQQALWEEHD
jgi:hypothetical protein